MMMKFIKVLQATSVAFFFAGSALAQTSGTVSNHAVAVGKGLGQTGFTSVTCADKLFLSGVSGLDPACRALVGADLPFPGVSTLGGVKSLAAASNQFLTGLGTDGALTRAQPAFSNLSGSATCAQLPAHTGDVTTTAGSCATAIGAGKVLSAMLGADVYSTAHTWAGQQTFVAPILGTPASANLANATALPIATGVSGLGTGVAAFLATPSSANLATAVTNETGSGALVFGTSPNITTPTGIVKGDVGLGNVANVDQTNASNIASGTLNTARLPSPFTSGTASGNTSKFATVNGSPTSGNCAQWDANGNVADAGASCGGGGGGGFTGTITPQGRLTLVTATPVMTSTQSAKTTIYYTPYVGNVVPIYDGTNLVATNFAELSIATTDTTKNPAAIGASKVNDWFVWNDSGTIRLSHGPDWTNDTTRSAGTALVRVNGIWLNNASITNGPAASRGTYVGTTRSNASSQLDYTFGGAASGGTAGFLGVWNTYNRVMTTTTVNDSGASYTYASATIRQQRGSAGMQISFVKGLSEDGIKADYANTAVPAAGAQGTFAIGLDTTTSFTGPFVTSTFNGAVGMYTSYAPTPAIGFHFVAGLERSDGGVGTISFFPNGVSLLTLTTPN